MRLFRESKTFILRVNKLGTTNYLSGVPFSTNLEEEKNEGTDEENENSNREELRERILSASLIHAKIVGFSNEAVETATKELGLSSHLDGLITNRGVELLSYGRTIWFNRLKEDLDPHKLDGLYTGEILKLGVRTYLSYIAPYIHKWTSVYQLSFHPYNLEQSFKEQARIIDLICENAGDMSIDERYYVKRGLLGGLLLKSEGIMMMDKTPDYEYSMSMVDQQVDLLMSQTRYSDILSDYSMAVGRGLQSFITIFKQPSDPLTSIKTLRNNSNEPEI